MFMHLSVWDLMDGKVCLELRVADGARDGTGGAATLAQRAWLTAPPGWRSPYTSPQLLGLAELVQRMVHLALLDDTGYDAAESDPPF